MNGKMKIWLSVFVALCLAVLLVYGCGSSSGGGSGSSNGVSMTAMGMSLVSTSGGVRVSSLGVLSSTVTGYVLNLADSSPIEGATVYAIQSAGTIIASAETNSSGAYSLSSIPSGEVSFTAFGPSSTQGFTVGVVTSASNCTFYLFPTTSIYETVSVTAIVSDESGAAISSAEIVTGTFGSASYSGALTNASGRVNLSTSVHPDYLSQFIICADKSGVGGGYASGVAVSTSSTTEIPITIRTPATASGSFSDTSGTYTNFSVWPAFASAYTRPGFTNLFMSNSTSTSYSGVMVPSVNSSSDSMLLVGFGSVTAESSPRISAGYNFVATSPSAGDTLSQNFSVRGAPTNFSFSTLEAGSLLYITVSWSAPSDWIPSYYYVDVSGAVVYTANTSCVFVMPLAQYQYWRAHTNYWGGVWAIEPTSSVDLDSVNLSDVVVSKGSFARD